MAISISAMTAEHNGTRTTFTFTGRTPNGEQIAVEFTPCVTIPRDRHSLPVLWYQHGFTATLLPSYWYVMVYATDVNGACWGRYNPTINRAGKIDFAWMLPATAENRDPLLAEIARRANGGC